jgi:hypothetical protein
MSPNLGQRARRRRCRAPRTRLARQSTLSLADRPLAPARQSTPETVAASGLQDAWMEPPAPLTPQTRSRRCGRRPSSSTSAAAAAAAEQPPNHMSKAFAPAACDPCAYSEATEAARQQPQSQPRAERRRLAATVAPLGEQPSARGSRTGKQPGSPAPPCSERSRWSSGARATTKTADS